MNALTVWIALGSLLCHVGLAVFFYGRLTQKVEGQGKQLDETKKQVDQHHGEIGVLYGRLEIPR